MKNSLADDREKHRTGAFNPTFIVWAAIVSIGLILLSIALGVGIDPDASMLAAP
jgi:hypothetical protein